MSELERAARGVLLAGFAGARVPMWVAEELGRGLGGICLYGNNIHPDTDLTDLARQVRRLAPDAVLAIDEEGGDVTRLHTAHGSPYAGPSVLGRLDCPSVTEEVAAGIGAELAAAGIWLDLAPCADVTSDPLNPVIGTRSFGADPALVARHAAAFVEGLATAGVAASVKHFPGHGDTRTDSHHALPVVRADRTMVRERDLAPFAAVASRAATVMTSHVVIEAVDPEHPATFSHTLLHEVLRAELGFQGVIVTDALDMVGAQQDGPWGTGLPGAAVRALAAGADLLCLGPGTRAGVAPVHAVLDAILGAVRDGRLPADRLLAAAARVGRLRDTWAGGPGHRGGAHPSRRKAQRDTAIRRAREASARAADAVVRGLLPMPAAPVVQLETTTSPAVGATGWGLRGTQTLQLAPEHLDTTPPPTGPALLLVRGATSNEVVWRWVREAMAGNSQTRLVELGWPDPALAQASWGDRVIRTYGASAASAQALARALGWVS